MKVVQDKHRSSGWCRQARVQGSRRSDPNDGAVG